ncbi:hypothetical protein ACIBG8_07095 [Nonomuraea sp. NPDC050556]|uniref:hypothetical protein n=1 Tax=Nonomuraea sp. NPDC050556 TaxID=3364369 RepID=UPI0037AA5E76
MSEPTEEQLVATGVDQRPWGPTEPDEEHVLRALGYVLNPSTGIYEGDPHDEDGEDA